MLPKKLTFVDLETTGGRALYDRVIEIGMIRVEDNHVIKEFSSLVNPNTAIPPEIERLTGISGNDVAVAPSFRSIADTVLELLEDSVFVAHNVRFDYGFLKHEFERLRINFSSRHFCTVRLSRTLFPRVKHHNLDSIIERYNLTCEQRHRALSDARMIHLFYQEIQKTVPLEKIDEAVTQGLKQPTLPPHLTKAHVSDLPETPGVYLFYGSDADAKHVPLYIGKSKNIRERVLSHFASDIRYATEMRIAQQVERIETIVTAGELGALLTESRLIKKLMPLYNKRLRVKRTLLALREKEQHGYKTVEFSEISEIDPFQLDGYIGFFSSRRQAKAYLSTLRKDNNLCSRLLGLENTKHACFSERLGTCKGACIGKESPLSYNARFTLAFSSSKIKPWPFSGPVSLSEYHPFSGLRETFVIDKWCLLGSLHSDDNGAERFQRHNETFDLDVYKILKQYIFNHTAVNIKTLPPEMLLRLKADEEFSDVSMIYGAGVKEKLL